MRKVGERLRLAGLDDHLDRALSGRNQTAENISAVGGRDLDAVWVCDYHNFKLNDVTGTSHSHTHTARLVLDTSATVNTDG